MKYSTFIKLILLQSFPFWSENILLAFQDLVRTRRYVKKFMLMRANIQAVSLKIQTLKSQNAMAQVRHL